MSFFWKISLLLWILNVLVGCQAGDRFRKKYYGSPPSSFYRKSSLSRSKLKYLFPTAVALGGIYVASRMRPRAHIRSYRDLDGYTVCEGRHMEANSLTGVSRTYSYFLCPDDPDQPFERYCCNDRSRGLGFCCSYDEKAKYYKYSRMGLLGGGISILCALVVVGLLVYCLCFRRKRSAGPTPAVPVYSPQTPGPYPGSPDKPVPPYPTGPAVVPYPNAQYAPTSVATPAPQFGSGWGVPPSSQPGSAWADPPPPPYSSVQQTAPPQPYAPTQ